MGGQKTHYQILEVSPQATDKQIRSAFRNKAKLYHPDRAPAGNAERFHRIQVAYEILCDPGRRRAYDESLRRPPERGRPGGHGGEERGTTSPLDEFINSFFGSQRAPKPDFARRRRPSVDPAYSDEDTDAGRYRDLDDETVDYDLFLSRAEAASGIAATLTTDWGGRVDVEIPPGVYHGEVLTLSYAVGGRAQKLRLLVHVR